MVRDTFLAVTELVECYDVLCAWPIVVGQYAFISLCLLPKVKVAAHPSPPLYNKAKRLCFPFFENNGV
ncbi:hypothetical protein HMPREF3034_00458 [Prevotella sp. DNF00663]|nr:hypothetical protein HMPREF3034_00458 [Prevotella sp. DNF00663]